MPAELAVTHTRQARNYHAGRAAGIRLIVVHAGITPESTGAAEGMVDFAAGPNARKASFHLAADVDSLARGVHDWDTAWGAPGANADGLHLEQAGQVQNRHDWTDPYSLKMIREQSARAVKDWHTRYGIPLVRLTVAQVADRKTKGVCSHHDVTRAFPELKGTHTDPGPEYPFDVLLAAAGQHPAAPPARKRNPFNRRDDLVRWTQWALGIPVDGWPGEQTKSALAAFRRRNNLDPAMSYPDPDTCTLLAQITR